MNIIPLKNNLKSIIGSTPVLILSILFIFFVGWLDYLMDYKIRTYPLYFIPLFIGSLGRGARTVIGLTLLATGLWLISNHISGLRFSTPFILLANISKQLISFVIVAGMSAFLGRKLIQESQLAQIDMLTGLLNHGTFFHQMETELERSRRYHYTVTIAYLDLDNFKMVNDRHGHAAGDELLVKIASTITRTIRITDLAARMGGDEFALLLIETDQNGAQSILQRLSQKLATNVFLNNDLSISIGAITCKAPQLKVDELIRLSDNLMYEVKRSGKNNILIKSI